MAELSQLSDEALQGLALDGNEQAEEMLAERYTRLVKVCARPFFLAGGDAEDLTQEGMLGLLSAIRHYDGLDAAAFKTYAERCIRNRLITAVKTASRKKHDPLNDGVSLDSILSDESQAQQAVFPEAFRRIPEEQVLARESETEFYSTIARSLSELEQAILKPYLKGLSYREIAGITGRSEKSVDNAVQRIRRKLASNLNLGDISRS